MPVPPLEPHTADIIAEALFKRIELDGGDADDLEIELAKQAVVDGPARLRRHAPEPRANRYQHGRQHGAVQEVADESVGPIADLAKAHDQRTLAGALHARLVADGNAPRAANVLATLKSFGIL
jgi:hypothetical protein